MSLNLIRQLCLILLPLSLIIALNIQLFIPATLWSESFYIIALTANIGYFTNFIAIKMLFKPYQPTISGRQGLIPKNQDKLASALSNTLNQHFLAAQHWQEYLDKIDIMPELLISTEKHAQQWISHSDNQALLIQQLISYLENNSAHIDKLLKSPALLNQLSLQASQNMDFNQLLNQGFVWIDKQFNQNPREMEYLIEPIIKTIAENIPDIAEKLINSIDEHIDNQDTIKRSIAKAARWSSNISQDDIQYYLFRMVASFEFRQTLFEGLHSLINAYKQQTQISKAPIIDIQVVINQILKNQIADIDIKSIIITQLQLPENRAALGNLLQNLISPAFAGLAQYLNQPEIKHSFNQQLLSIINKLDLTTLIEKKAKQFSAEKMQSIFQNIISEQLIFIELLGAVLGGMSGLALIDLATFGIFSGILISYFFFDHYLTLWRDRNIEKKSKLRC